MNKKTKNWIIWSSAFALLVAADQLVKHLVTSGKDNLPLALIKNVISITHTKNTGAAFSLFQSLGWLFSILALIALAAIIYILARGYFKSTWGTWGLIFVAAGAAGNLTDRLLHGYVVDMIKLEFIDFAVFNVADTWVTVGAGCLIIYLFCYFEKEHAKENHP